jgi:hypothetical protein
MELRLALNSIQVKKLVEQMSDRDREQLFRYLGKKTFGSRLGQLLKKLQVVPLTQKDIDAEVEEVRSRRYARRSGH